MRSYHDSYERLQGRLLERAGVAVHARHVELPRTGARVHVLEAGAGEPVVILHGGAGIGAEHIPLLAHLSKRFRVVLPDRPGHGLSDDFQYRRDLRPADLVAALLDALAIDRAAVVGNSYGGLMAAQFALAHPERVSKLVLMGFFPGIDRPLPTLMRITVAPVFRYVLGRLSGRPTIETTRELFSRLLVAHVERMPGELLELEAMHSLRHRRSIASLLRASVNVRALDLTRIAVPTFWLWGERDPFMPVVMARAVAATMPDAHFSVIPDAGHLPTSDQPLETARQLEHALGLVS